MGGGSPTAHAGSLREIGGLRCGRKTGGGSPTAHAGSWVVACEIEGLAWTGRMQDRRWQPHRPCWVISRNRGLAWMWTQGGGSPTARAGSLLAKPGACGDVETRQVVAAPRPVLGRCSRNRGAHMDMAAPSPTLGRCSRNRGARGDDRGPCAAFQLAGRVAGADAGPFAFRVGYGGGCGPVCMQGGLG